VFNPNIDGSTRWRNGRSGDPSGKPRTKILSEAYRAVLAMRSPADTKRRSFAELIALRLAIAAAGGDLRLL
jgi:hypothetical protein